MIKLQINNGIDLANALKGMYGMDALDLSKKGWEALYNYLESLEIEAVNFEEVIHYWEVQEYNNIKELALDHDVKAEALEDKSDTEALDYIQEVCNSYIVIHDGIYLSIS